MKQKTANLGFNFAALPPSSRSARATTENSVVLAGEPDISDCDGRYGFTRSWEWIRQIPVPENWSGAPVPVTLSVTADDSAMLTMGGLSVSASYSGGPGEDETTGALKPGYYQARMSFTNIDYEPPEGNVAVLSWSISAGVSGTLVPEENPKPIREADCTCGDDDSGGPPPAVSRSRAASASSSSSAGRNTRLETKESHVRWRTDFGKFRGMGGVPAGALEITAHEFSSASATPAALEFSHPFNSWLVFPPSGVAANAQLKLFCGGSCTSWMCDGNGETFFPLGASSGETSALRWNADKSAIEQVFPDKSVLAFSAGTGEIVSFKTRHGNAFSAAELSAYVDVVRDAEGVLLQVRNLWDGLANVENVSETGYEIALYLPNQIGEKSAETGRYAVSGTPFKKFVVAYSPETGKLSITERDMRAGARAFPRALWFENGAWCTSVGAGAEEIVTRRSRTALTETTYRLVTEVAFAGSSVPASRVAEIYEIHPVLGDVLASRTEGYGTDSARTTHYLYDSAGRLIRETRPDGSVVESGYDDFGRLSARYEPHAGARNRTTLYRYVSADSNDPDLSWTQTSLSTTAGPVVLSRTDYVYAEEAEYRRVEKRTSGLGFDGVRLEVEETWRGDCGNVHARGRVKMTQNVLGVQTHYAYAATSAHGALYSVCAETRIAGEPVNGKSTREVRFVSAEGNTTRSEKYALDEAGTWRLIASVDFEYDAQNRETKRTRGNGRVSSREMMCCGPLWETDEDGVRTDYVYDSAQRLTEETRALTATTPERTRLYERDAAGRVTRETLKLNSVDFSEKTATWDLLGRLVSETDELGRATSYAYAEDASSCTTTETATLPSGATRVTKTHADGTVLLEAGTSRRGVETLVDFVSDGMRRTRRLAELPSGATEPVVLSREITNGFGETIRAGTPDTLGGMIYERRSYDARGLLVRAGTDGLAPVLYEYDAFGEETKRVVALAEEPTPTNSRVTETATRFETFEDGNVFRVVSSTVYDAAGTALVSSVATLVSENATLESKVVSTDVRGNATTRLTEYGAPGIRVLKTQIPTATNLAQETRSDGFVVSRIDHAGTQTTFARQFNAGANAGIVLTTTDGRGNASVVEQNVLGWTTKTTDAAGNATTTAYDLAHGKPSCVTDALGKTHRFAYDLHGNVAAEFGTGAQPAVFAYDAADRKISQKLFRVSSETIETDPRSRTDGDETTWTYHAATGLLLSKTYPDASGIGYAYDAHNRLSSTTFSREVSAGTRLKVSRAYAELTGELVSVSYNDGTPGETHTYNHLGQVTRTVDASGTRAYVYNRYNEVGTARRVRTRHGLCLRESGNGSADDGRELCGNDRANRDGELRARRRAENLLLCLSCGNVSCADADMPEQHDGDALLRGGAESALGHRVQAGNDARFSTHLRPRRARASAHAFDGEKRHDAERRVRLQRAERTDFGDARERRICLRVRQHREQKHRFGNGRRACVFDQQSESIRFDRGKRRKRVCSRLRRRRERDFDSNLHGSVDDHLQRREPPGALRKRGNANRGRVRLRQPRPALLQKSDGRGNGYAASPLHLSRLFADRVRGFDALRAPRPLVRDLGSVAADGDAPARDSKRRHLVHLRLRHHEKRLRSLRARRLHPHELQLRALRRSHRFRRRFSALPMVIGTLRFRACSRVLQLPPLLARPRSLA